MMRAFVDEVRHEAGGRRVVLTLGKPAGQENRRHDRVPAQDRIHITPLREDGSADPDAAYEAVAINFSEGGMAFLQHRLAVADRIIIGIPTEGGPQYLAAEVRHWREVGEKLVELGCRFAAAPAAGPPPAARPEDVVGPLIARFQARPAGPDERRNHPRVHYPERVEVRGQPGTVPVVGFGRDLSRGGIAFIATAPLPLEAVTLVLPQGPGDHPAHVRAQVVRCGRITEGFYDVAARFLEAEGPP
jgi:hypothetical protein